MKNTYIVNFWSENKNIVDMPSPWMIQATSYKTANEVAKDKYRHYFGKVKKMHITRTIKVGEKDEIVNSHYRNGIKVNMSVRRMLQRRR